MILDWREKFNMPNLPFLFVQLAAYINDGSFLLADLRAAQLATLKLPGVGMGTAIDAGDLASPWNQIHPRDKEIVGSRLVASGLRFVYKNTTVQYRGPQLVSVTTASGGGITLTYASDPLSPGPLYIKPNVTCPSQAVGKAGVCHAIQVYPQGGGTAVECMSPTYTLSSALTIDVTCPGVNIVAGDTIWYGIADYPLLSIYNTAGDAHWPAQPFIEKVLSPTRDSSVRRIVSK